MAKKRKKRRDHGEPLASTEPARAREGREASAREAVEPSVGALDEEHAVPAEPLDDAPEDAAPAPPRDLRVPLLVAAVALAVDLPRVCRTVSIEGDSATFTSAAATFGVPQPSGYPLQTLVGFFATKLVPFGELPFRVHLLSACFHAATVAVVALLVHRLTRSRAAAIGGALFLAFSRAFFHGSHYAEAFPLDDLFGALVLYVGFALLDQRREDALTRTNALVTFALVCGLASAHHQMIALSAPALVYLLRRARVFGLLKALATERKGRGFALVAAAFFLPFFSLYALLLVAAGRDPYVSWGEIHDLPTLLAVATRRDFGGLFSPNLAQVSKDVSRVDLVVAWGESFVRSFTWLGVALVLLGAFVTLRRKDERAITCAIFAFVAGPVFAALNVLPISDERGVAFVERFHTLSFVPLAIFVGAGLAAVIERVAILLPASIARLVGGLAFVLPLVLHARDVDLSTDRLGASLAHDLFVEVPDHALVLVSGDAMLGASLHACAVEQTCGDRIVFSPGQLHLPWKISQLHRRHPDLGFPKPAGEFLTTRELVAANLPFRPVFIAPFILDAEPALRDAFSVLPAGLLVRVFPAGSVDVESIHDAFIASATALPDRLEGASLRSYDLRHPSLEAQIPPIYALAFENHARVARAIFDDAPLAAELEAHAVAIDPAFVKRLGDLQAPATAQ